MLDSLTRWQLQEVLMEVWTRTQVTAICVTHDVDEAILLADRVVMMTNGPNAKIGRILEVDLPRPRTRKALLAHPDYYAYREQVPDLPRRIRTRRTRTGEGRSRREEGRRRRWSGGRMMDIALDKPARTFIEVAEVWVPEGDRLVFGSGNYGALADFAAVSGEESFGRGEGLPGKRPGRKPGRWC